MNGTLGRYVNLKGAVQWDHGGGGGGEGEADEGMRDKAGFWMSVGGSRTKVVMTGKERQGRMEERMAL